MALVSLHEFFEQRDAARRAFADAHGHGDSVMELLYEDMASRRFYRLRKGDATLILMDSLPDDHPQATPGHKLSDYITLARALRDAGIHAPVIEAADEAGGFILMEDLGDTPPGDRDLDAAIDVLTRMRARLDARALALPDYYHSHIHAAHRRVVDWYMPCARGVLNPPDWIDAYGEIWQAIERNLPAPPTGFVHADFHRGNLRLLDHDCGVLDFQGAQHGPLAYDLVNLLEDGRAVLPPDLKEQYKARYTQSLPPDMRAAFDLWYAVLSVQFHCRLAGQFIKLAIVGGKPRYLDYVPLVQSYLRTELRNPLFAPLADFFAARGITFEESLTPQATLIAPGAY